MYISPQQFKDIDLLTTATSSGGGGKKPPKKPPTKTGGLPDKDPKKDWEIGKNIELPKRYMTPEDWKKETGNGY